jgi:hypothetical protein
MIEPATILTLTLGVASLIKKFSKFKKDLRAAQPEFKCLARQVECFEIGLQTVHSSLQGNKNDIANEDRIRLDRILESCEASLKEGRKLWETYKGMSLQQRSKWRSRGKQDAQIITADLLAHSQSIDGFLNRLNQTRINGKLDMLLNSSAHGACSQTQGQRIWSITSRPQLYGQVQHPIPGQILFTVLAINRLRRRLYAIRERKQRIRARKVTIPNTKARTQRSLRVDGGSRYAEPKLKSPKQLSCWLVTENSYTACSAFKSHTYQPLKRTQTELEEMVDVFQAASAESRCAVASTHKAVDWIIDHKNHGKRERKWSFAAGRLASRAYSPHGNVRSDEIIVVLKRSVKA